ncbi:unnamed protein product [Sphagnum tenellum]
MHDRRDPPVKIYSINQTLKHPAYSSDTFANDFALLRLEVPLTWSDDPLDILEVGPICLPDASVDYAGYGCVATGWGQTSEGGWASDILQKVDLHVGKGPTKCGNYREGMVDHKVMMCASGDYKDSCPGDSGGPLVTLGQKGLYQLIGVTSAGLGCGDAAYPGVYARVNEALPWIYGIVPSLKPNGKKAEPIKGSSSHWSPISWLAMLATVLLVKVVS